MIYTTHNTHLLNTGFQRRDQVYFVNKREDGSSDLYSLFDFKDFRDTLDMEKASLEIIAFFDRRRQEIEKNLTGTLRDSDLMELHGLESTLVYFATSLRANSTVLDRLTRYKRLEQYPDDMELLDDVIVEIRQAIEMTSIYRDDIKGTRELFSSILDNRLNNAMKYLTSVTLLMAVPTVISGLYGMNVDIDGMPFSGSDYGFVIVCLLTLAICGIAAWVLHKKHML